MSAAITARALGILGKLDVRPDRWCGTKQALPFLIDELTASNAAVPPSQSVGVDAGSADALGLSGIEARANAATPGPWQTRFIYRMFSAARRSSGLLFSRTQARDWPDAEFIAHARTDIPALIAEVRRLQLANELHEAEKAPRGAMLRRIQELEAALKSEAQRADSYKRFSEIAEVALMLIAEPFSPGDGSPAVHAADLRKVATTALSTRTALTPREGEDVDKKAD